MPPTPSRKRQRQAGYNRKHDRHKFRRTTNPTVHKKSLPSNLSGILFSCTPRHEDRAFRDAVLLLSKHCDRLHPTRLAKSPVDSGTEVSTALEQELAEIRAPEDKLFTRIDGGVQGCVFVSVRREGVELERVVELALREARDTGFAPSRHCIRMLPVHTTCYAKPVDVAHAAVGVVDKHFPSLGEGGVVTYAIVFRARLNDGAHRDEYIQAIAGAIQDKQPGYKVDLTNPTVVLIVEIVKTTCCLGTFRYFYELAKMNLREAACPTKPKDGGGKPSVDSGKGKAGELEGANDGKTIEGESVGAKEAGEETGTGSREGDAGKDQEHGVGSSAEVGVVEPAEGDKSPKRDDSSTACASGVPTAKHEAKEGMTGDGAKSAVEKVDEETQTAKPAATEDSGGGTVHEELGDDGKVGGGLDAEQECEQAVPACDDGKGETAAGDVDNANTK